MNVQFAIREAGRHHRLRAGGQPARLAHRAFRQQGHRPTAGQDRGTLHGRAPARDQQAARTPTAEVVPRTASASRKRVFPFNKFPGRRPDPRAGDALHRRGDGRRRHLAEAFAEEPAGANIKPPRQKGISVITVKNADKTRVLPVAQDLVQRGFSLVVARPPAHPRGRLPARMVNKVKDGRPHRRHDQGRRDPVHQHHRDAHRVIADSRHIRTAPLAHRTGSPTPRWPGEGAWSGDEPSTPPV